MANRTATGHGREAIREADRLKDEFLATLSHELRNPLAPLRTGLQFLRLHERGDPTTTRVHEMMERQVNHLVRLVDDLLEMSRISRGTLELRKERIEVATIVRNAIETSDHLIKEHRHQLSVFLPVESIWIDGDAIRLAQVIANLLSNAAKYTDSGGHIVVQVRHDANAVISVSDNGAGIASEMLPRVFEMFNRGDRRGDQDGLGIGLTVARRLVELHGGTIAAHSQGPRLGSEFVVRLPLAGNQAPASVSESPTRASLIPQRVLIVDDNADAGDCLRLLLESLGADVRVARGGPEALQVIQEYDPVTVLLDIGMPGMDGYEVARGIHARFSGRPRPAIVALTGWGQPEDRRRASEAGFDHHLIKPADINVLQKLLCSIHRVPEQASSTALPSIPNSISE